MARFTVDDLAERRKLLEAEELERKRKADIGPAGRIYGGEQEKQELDRFIVDKLGQTAKQVEEGKKTASNVEDENIVEGKKTEAILPQEPTASVAPAQILEPPVIGSARVDIPEQSQDILDYEKKLEADKAARKTLDTSYNGIQDVRVAQNKADKEKFGKLADKYQSNYDRASQALSEANEQLKDSSIDMDRFVDRMPEAMKVINLVAVALGGIIQGLRGDKTPNHVLNAFNKAVDRDIAKQRQEATELMRSRNLSKEEVAIASDALKANEAAYKLAANNIASLQIAKLANEKNSLKATAVANQIIMQLKVQNKQNAIANKISLKGIQSVESRSRASLKQQKELTMFKASEAGKKIKDTPAGAKNREKVRDLIIARNAMNALQESYKKAINDKGVFTDTAAEHDYNAKRKIATRLMIKATSGGAATEDEVKRIASELPSTSKFSGEYLVDSGRADQLFNAQNQVISRELKALQTDKAAQDEMRRQVSKNEWLPSALRSK